MRLALERGNKGYNFNLVPLLKYYKSGEVIFERLEGVVRVNLYLSGQYHLMATTIQFIIMSLAILGH